MTSMTGHGRGEARMRAWSAVVECFSVNRKTAEVVCHTERGSAWLEPIVRERAMARVARGRVQVSVVLEPSDGAVPRILDARRAAAFLREAKALQQKLSLPGEITLSDVLSAPGVARPAEPARDGAREAVVSALDAALDGLAATRGREGAALGRILTKSARRLGALVKKIQPLARHVASSHRETLLRRLAGAGLGISLDDPRMVTEIAFFAERADITEELQRIASHLGQFLEKLSATGSVGRTLEFLAQELGREFNTIGSKSPDAAISRLVIEAKSELDRIREQLANVE